MAGEDAAEETPFGRYRLIKLLGRGGMGEVWRAHDTDTDRIVAIKVLPAHLSDDEDFQRRFRREAHAAARLNNPHVIPIHNYGEIDGRLYVDMRLVEGRDLQEVLARGPLEPGRAVRIIEQVAKALQAAHKVGLVHRDVKPSNILLDEDDFAYLIDFGIARGADETGLTGTGAMIGSWHYMAPERLRAHETDARADIYALACVLYECLTGQRPFPGDSLESQVAAHLTDPPPQPSTAKPNVPAQLDAVIAKGMAKNPDHRYATTVELANAARDALITEAPDRIAAVVTETTPPRAGPTEPAEPTLTATQLRDAGPIPPQRAEPPTTRRGIDITEANFEGEVLVRSNQVPVVVLLWSPRSGVSLELADILSGLAAADGGKWSLAKVNVDMVPRVAQIFGVEMVPTVVALAAGQPLSSFSGMQPAHHLRRWLDALLSATAVKLNGATGSEQAEIASAVAQAGGAFPSPLPPAGWYADPKQHRGKRYWDGAKWTEHTAP